MKIFVGLDIAMRHGGMAAIYKTLKGHNIAATHSFIIPSNINDMPQIINQINKEINEFHAKFYGSDLYVVVEDVYAGPNTAISLDLAKIHGAILAKYLQMDNIKMIASASPSEARTMLGLPITASKGVLADKLKILFKFKGSSMNADIIDALGLALVAEGKAQELILKEKSNA